MKTISKKLLAVILLLSIAVSPLGAQTNEPVESEKANTAIVVTNIPAAQKTKFREKKADSVRIDQTGVHIGGDDPVDINLPNYNHNSSFGNFANHLVELFAIFAVFGMPVAIVGMFFYFRHRKSRMLHETLRAMVEKGVPIPPELLGGRVSDCESNVPAVYPAHRERKDLRNGIILIGVGTGVTALVGKAGVIILFIGVAMVVVGLIEKKDRPNPPTDK